MLHTDQERGVHPCGRSVVLYEILEGAPQAGLERTGSRVLRSSGFGPRPIEVTREHRITPIDVRQQPLYETRLRRAAGQPVVDPLTVSHPLDQPGLAEDAQMTANTRLTLAQGLRKALLISATTRPALPDEPGVLLLAEDLSLAAITPTAEKWLAEVAAADWPRTQQALPYAVEAAARLQALERDSDVQPDLLPKVRLRTASGHWLVLHASRLGGPSASGQIAVIIEAARPAEVAPLIVQAYDLTKRESEIMQSVLRGLSTGEISATYQISSNTVQDHLKSIFEKVGVRSRRELAGQLFAQQYQPRLGSGRDLDANGWFT